MFKKQNAFTLIELLVTLVVLGVVVSLAAPSFTLQILNNRSVVLAEDFIAELNLARYEAVKRATRVSLCASSNGTTCVGNWEDGFITFVDAAAATPPVPIVGVILRVWPKPDDRTVLTVQQAADITFIRYTALGGLARIGAAAAPINIVTRMEGCKGEHARAITIGIAGFGVDEQTTLSIVIFNIDFEVYMNRLVFMKTSNLKQARGAGLIEVLITMLILSASLMSLAALQMRSLQYNQGAYLRSQANILAYDMLDRMRLNKLQGPNYALIAAPFVVGSAPPATKPVAAFDHYEWRRDIDARLPAGTGAIAFNAATRVYTITINWREINSSGRAEEDVSVYTYEARL